MPEQRTRGAAPDDALATMNDHLARFFQHADVLLREWKDYGDKLRASIDAEVRELEGVVARAVSEAGRAAASTLDRQVEQAMAQAVDASVASLRRELESLARLAGQTGARMAEGGGTPAPAEARPRAATRRPERSPAARPMILALTTANVMLIALLFLTTRMCRSEAPRDAGQNLGSAQNGAQGQGALPAATPDAAPPPHDAGPSSAALCTPLAQGYDAEAARAFIVAAAGEICPEPLAAGVTATLSTRLDSAKDEPAKDDKSGADKGDKKTPSRKSRSGSAPRKGD